MKPCTGMVLLLSLWYEVAVLLHLLRYHFEESQVWWEEMELSTTENFLESVGGT